MRRPNSSRPPRTASEGPKPDIPLEPDRLSPSEIERLKRRGREAAAYAQKVWPRLKIHRLPK